MRSHERNNQSPRPISFEPNYLKYPEGSCLVRMGNTMVICTASVEEKVPPFIEGKNQGWVTAEYSMLPRATHTRNRRESTTGKPSGRTQEIQRLIGRALRSVVDLSALGVRTITIDCDVIQADGGTRTASINGGFVALALAIQQLQKKGKIATSPIRAAVGAISVGLKSGTPLVDLDYNEDSSADVDMNLVMLEGGKWVEIQGTGEGATFSAQESQTMIALGQIVIERIHALQKETLQNLS